MYSSTFNGPWNEKAWEPQVSTFSLGQLHFFSLQPLQKLHLVLRLERVGKCHVMTDSLLPLTADRRVDIDPQGPPSGRKHVKTSWQGVPRWGDAVRCEFWPGLASTVARCSLWRAAAYYLSCSSTGSLCGKFVLTAYKAKRRKKSTTPPDSKWMMVCTETPNSHLRVYERMFWPTEGRVPTQDEPRGNSNLWN